MSCKSCFYFGEIKANTLYAWCTKLHGYVIGEGQNFKACDEWISKEESNETVRIMQKSW